MIENLKLDSKPLRVLQFGRFWNDEHGGVERHVDLLCKSLVERGVEVVNLVASKDLQSHDEMVHGYRIVQAPSFGKAFSTAMSPAMIWRARQLHAEKPFDIFHFHFPDPLTHFVSMFLPRDVPRVITWHSDIVKQKKLLALYKPLLQREVLKADAIIAGTQANFDSSTQIPRSFPISRKRVIPFGLDYSNLVLTPRTDALRQSIRKKICDKAGVSEADSKVVFALGRHVSYKGFDVLIESMRFNQAQLLLGGDGPIRHELEALAIRLGLQHRVTFTGRISEEDLGAYFHAADVFCLSSVTVVEAFGLVQLEAMACGKPVVNTQLGNGVNVVNIDGLTGLTAPVGDAAALGECLNRVLVDDDLRETLGKQAFDRSQQYSLYSMVTSHELMYCELVSAAR